MASDDDDRKRDLRQLAFAGWVPEPDADAVTTDDWYTPPELVGEIGEWLGGIDLDPCWSPRSFVRPRVAYTEYEVPSCFEPIDGLAPLVVRSNGLGNPWRGNVGGVDIRSRFVNPPYSRPGPWLTQLDELHALGSEGDDSLEDSIALVRIDTSTWWWKLAWHADAICWLYFRVPFVRPNSTARSQPRDHHAMIYWGPRAESFRECWSWLGHVTLNDVVELDRLKRSTARRLDLLYPPDPTDAHRCPRHGVYDCEDCAEAVTAVDEPIVELDARAEHPQAWPAVGPIPPLSCPGCGAYFETKRAQQNHRCLAGGAR